MELWLQSVQLVTFENLDRTDLGSKTGTDWLGEFIERVTKKPFQHALQGKYIFT
jgi:hypothetical protein